MTSTVGVEEMEELRTLGCLETLQPPYHMFHRDIENEILPYTDKHNLDDTAAADTPLSEHDLAEIDQILADSVPMWGPHPEGM